MILRSSFRHNRCTKVCKELQLSNNFEVPNLIDGADFPRQMYCTP